MTKESFKYKNSGFTILELLVVIAIIGILASIVITAVGDSQQKAKDKTFLAVVDSIHKGLNICFLGGSAINIPSEGNAGGGLMCTGGPTYPQLPEGWIYCDGVSNIGGQSDTDCGNEKSTQNTGVTYSIVYEENPPRYGRKITCGPDGCTTATEGTPN